MFGKLLFFFVFPKLGISYKVKKDFASTVIHTRNLVPLEEDISGNILDKTRDMMII